MNAEQQGSSGTWVFAVLGVGLLLLLIAVSLPSLGDIKVGTHAVKRHGTDALSARAQLNSCKRLKTKLCPKKPGGYGLTVVFWCETGKSLCPGMYTTVGGLEKTTFIRPCSQWRNCQ